MTSIIAQKDEVMADRDRILAYLKSAIAFKKQANEDKRKAEGLLRHCNKKQQEQKVVFDLEKAELLKEIAMLKDFVNQARGESSAKDEEIKALSSAKIEMEAAYAQLEKDMVAMEENYQTHLLEIDPRTRMELMKEYKSGDHLQWKPDEVINDYYMLFPESNTPEAANL